MLPPGYWRYRERDAGSPAAPCRGMAEDDRGKGGENQSKEDWGGDSHPKEGSGYGKENRGIRGKVIGESCRVVDIVLVIPENEILDQDPGAKLMVKLGAVVRVWDECLLHGC